MHRTGYGSAAARAFAAHNVEMQVLPARELERAHAQRSAARRTFPLGIIASSFFAVYPVLSAALRLMGMRCKESAPRLFMWRA
jgi:hypothetical protein